jgi:hypothetical protein
MNLMPRLLPIVLAALAPCAAFAVTGDFMKQIGLAP